MSAGAAARADLSMPGPVEPAGRVVTGSYAGRVLSGTGLVVARNWKASQTRWYVVATGLAEPLLYLLSIGIGVGGLVEGFTIDGQQVDYAAYVAPGLLAAAAMNGAVMDGSFNFFFRLKFDKVYTQQLSTPLTPVAVGAGQLVSALLRGAMYSAFFLVAMVVLGLTSSWWAVLALPAAIMVGLAFGGMAMTATAYAKSFSDLEYVTLVTLPLFLFSATFFPLGAFPGWLQPVVEWSPLYRGVVLCRELTTGTPGWDSVISVIYLGILGAVALWAVSRRLERLLLS